MKKLLLTALIAAMLLVPLGTVALADDESTRTPSIEYTDVHTAEPLGNAEYIPGQAPAQSDAAIMTPALHAVLLALGSREMDSFSTENQETSWEMLYNLLSMYGQLDERSEYDGEMLVLPSETVTDYACAILSEVPSPDRLPESLSDRMTYDPASDCYYLYCGSDGLSEVQITNTEEHNGSVELSGKLVYLAEDMELAQFTATLELSDTLFGYTLKDLEVL